MRLNSAGATGSHQEEGHQEEGQEEDGGRAKETTFGLQPRHLGLQGGASRSLWGRVPPCANYVCPHCAKPLTCEDHGELGDNLNLQVDHVIPRSRRKAPEKLFRHYFPDASVARDSLLNYMLACEKCNGMKSDSDWHGWARYLARAHSKADAVLDLMQGGKRRRGNDPFVEIAASQDSVRPLLRELVTWWESEPYRSRGRGAAFGILPRFTTSKGSNFFKVFQIQRNKLFFAHDNNKGRYRAGPYYEHVADKLAALDKKLLARFISIRRKSIYYVLDLDKPGVLDLTFVKQHVEAVGELLYGAAKSY
jgi:hypothetical protein